MHTFANLLRVCTLANLLRVCTLANLLRVCTLANLLRVWGDLQIRQEAYGRSVDIWALGVMTYELLVGSNPFRSSSSTEQMRVGTKLAQGVG